MQNLSHLCDFHSLRYRNQGFLCNFASNFTFQRHSYLQTIMYKILYLLIVLVALLTPHKSQASDFTVSGVWYNVISFENHTCEVAAAPDNLKYKGIIAIPSTVVFKDITFSVVGIGKYAFSRTRITGIKLPLSLKRIGNVAFGDCELLTSITLPDSIEEIGNSCFARCSKLQRISFPKSLKKIGTGILEDCIMLQNVSIPEGVQNINGAFSGCTNLRTVTLPQSLKETGIAAFHECHAIQNVSLPHSVKAIGPSCYSRSRGLRSVKIPDSIDTIQYSAFQGCPNLSIVQFPSSLKEIGSESFAECKMIKKVDLPNSLLSLGNSAFANCPMLSEVKLKEGLKSIGSDAFIHCSKLQEIFIPQSVAHIGQRCFYGCSNLKHVNIPTSIENIPICMLTGCHLSKLFIHNGIRKIGMNSLDKCDTLIIEDSKKRLEIENDACSVIAPNLYIGRYLHFSCAKTYFIGVRSLTIGKDIKSVSYILSYMKMNNVTEIKCLAPVPPEPSTFDNRDFMNITLIVPQESIEDYKKHPIWGKFLTIKEL